MAIKISRPCVDSNKHDCGRAVIYGAVELTGATRLASQCLFQNWGRRAILNRTFSLKGEAADSAELDELAIC
jgi:hypothetical protein